MPDDPPWSYATGSEKRRPWRGDRKQRPVIEGHSPEEEFARRTLLATSGVQDTGQSFTDARQLAAGTRATPMSGDMAALKSGARPQNWFPNNGARTGGTGTVRPTMVAPRATPSNGYDARVAGAFAASPAPVVTGTGEGGRNAAAIGAHRENMIAAGSPTPVGEGPGAGSSAPFRGSTGAEVADFWTQVGPKEMLAAAGTGAPVKTPYGTVSSTGGTPAPLTWEQQLTAKYPGIGEAGNDQNKRFTAHFNALQPADRTPENAMNAATKMFGGLDRKAPAAGRNLAAPSTERLDPAAPLLQPDVQKAWNYATAPASTGVGAALDAITPGIKSALGSVLTPKGVDAVTPIASGVKRGLKNAASAVDYINPATMIPKIASNWKGVKDTAQTGIAAVQDWFNDPEKKKRMAGVPALGY